MGSELNPWDAKITNRQFVINSVTMQIDQPCLKYYTVDTKSKYPLYNGRGQDFIWVGASEHSLKTDSSKKDDTLIEFGVVDPNKWTIFVETGRYSLYIAFINIEYSYNIKTVWANNESTS